MNTLLRANFATPVLALGYSSMREAREHDAGGGRPGSRSALREPDISLCRAKRSGLRDHVDCLMEYPGRCPHSLNFGSCCFCVHPRRKEIAANTEVGLNDGSVQIDRGLAIVAW